MPKSRPEVACRIDGVARCTAKRETNAPNEACDEIRTKSRTQRIRSQRPLRKNRCNDENKNEGCDCLTKEVGERIPDCRTRAEAGKFSFLVRSFGPMRI